MSGTMSAIAIRGDAGPADALHAVLAVHLADEVLEVLLLSLLSHVGHSLEKLLLGGDDVLLAGNLLQGEVDAQVALGLLHGLSAEGVHILGHIIVTGLDSGVHLALHGVLVLALHQVLGKGEGELVSQLLGNLVGLGLVVGAGLGSLQVGADDFLDFVHALFRQSTGIGAALALFVKRTDTRMLTFALGASAGVMVYISFMELMPSAAEMLAENAKWVTTLAFFGGMALACIIDRMIPEDENPHEVPSPGCLDCVHPTGEFSGNAKLRRSALLFTLAIAIHNFPEGIATVASAFDNTGIATSVALAVAIHNIPEGIAVAIPIYYATKSKGKALLYATLSGMSEVIGAALCLAVTAIFGIELTGGSPAFPLVLSAVAGIMIYISLDELLPTAEKYGKHHIAIAGVVGGMALMGISLLIM